MGKDKVETLETALKTFRLQFEVKKRVLAETVVEAKTRTDAIKQFKSNSDSLDLESAIASGQNFGNEFVGNSVRAIPTN